MAEADRTIKFGFMMNSYHYFMRVKWSPWF